jgi:hypothetical protein
MRRQAFFLSRQVFSSSEFASIWLLGLIEPLVTRRTGTRLIKIENPVFAYRVENP